MEKLSWLNGQWLRELSVEQFADAARQWAFNSDYVMQIAPHVQGRVETLSEIAPLAGFFFSGGVPLTPELFAHKKNSAVIKFGKCCSWCYGRWKLTSVG